MTVQNVKLLYRRKGQQKKIKNQKINVIHFINIDTNTLSFFQLHNNNVN